MTFSILAKDPETGALGGAAATGSLCVGGWVLRGDIRAGMSASQGASPSTFWGEDVLSLMRDGMAAPVAVSAVVDPDDGKEHRQLSALDRDGGSGAYTGGQNTDAKGSRVFKNGIVAGNLLTSESVLDAMQSAYETAEGPFAERLLTALRGAEHAGSDSRGLQSAALLIVSDYAAPLTLRIDYADHPITALEGLYKRSQTSPYVDWLSQVPTVKNPFRKPN